ncbi:uncharacterized protein LOC135163296 isoform X1 [Diachasmimorpha longicaudata]|uniref:uncharacterized protein LOC135163296 isoform X1 n=2 Tax=Diachasmimorpha longicaudata TaxID=58733 RepID=UPI0030B8E318
MSGLVLFTDNIFYITKINDISLKGKTCSVKYRDKKKYAARVLAISNDDTVLENLKLNFEGKIQKVKEIWKCVNLMENTYVKACKEITNTKDDTVLFVDKTILSENYESVCTQAFLSSVFEGVDDFFAKSSHFLKLTKIQSNNEQNDNASKPKSQKRKNSPTSRELKMNTKRLKDDHRSSIVNSEEGVPHNLMDWSNKSKPKIARKRKKSPKSGEFDMNAKRTKDDQGFNSVHHKEEAPYNLMGCSVKLNSRVSQSQCSIEEIPPRLEDEILDNTCAVDLCSEIKQLNSKNCRRRLNFSGPAFDPSNQETRNEEKLTMSQAGSSHPEQTSPIAVPLKIFCGDQTENLEQKKQISGIQETLSTAVLSESHSVGFNNHSKPVQQSSGTSTMPFMTNENQKSCRKRLDFNGQYCGASTVIQLPLDVTAEGSELGRSKCDEKLQITKVQVSASDNVSPVTILPNSSSKNPIDDTALEERTSPVEKETSADVVLQDSSYGRCTDLELAESVDKSQHILSETFTVELNDAARSDAVELNPDNFQAGAGLPEIISNHSTSHEPNSTLESDVSVEKNVKINSKIKLEATTEHSVDDTNDRTSQPVRMSLSDFSYQVGNHDDKLIEKNEETTIVAELDLDENKTKLLENLRDPSRVGNIPGKEKEDVCKPVDANDCTSLRGGTSPTDFPSQVGNHDEKFIEENEDTTIIPDSDCDENDTELLKNLRVPFIAENLSVKKEKDVYEPLDHNFNEKTSTIPARNSTFDELLCKKFVAQNVTVTESFLEDLLHDYGPQSAPSEVEDCGGVVTEQSRNNVEVDSMRVDGNIPKYHNSNKTPCGSLKKSVKTKGVPKLTQIEVVERPYYIFRKTEQCVQGNRREECSRAHHREIPDESVNNGQNDDNPGVFGRPRFHSTMCDSRDEATETIHSRDEEITEDGDEEISEDGDSSDNYNPEEDNNQEPDSDEYTTEEELEKESHPPEPLNITHQGNPPISAPDDRDLHVDVSSSGTKKHFCLYCHKFQTKLARHLTLVHADQEDVKKFMVLPPGTRERQEIISVIRKNGDFVFNSDRRFNDGSLIVCRRPTPKMRKTAEDFTVCANCKGQYSKSVVRHHFRECAKHDGKNQRIVLVKGKKIAARVHSRASVDVRNKIFPYLREDEVVKSIRYDELVTLYANKMCEKHGTHQHLFQMIRAKLRLLGRFLIAIRKIENRIENFSDVYQPRFYDAAVDAVRVVAKFDPEKKIFDAPAVAAGYGTLLKKVGEILRSECIKKERVDEQKRLEDFLKLLEEDYGTSINRAVTETQTQNNRRKEVILPTTDDIKKLFAYVTTERKAHFEQLSKKFSYTSWEDLSKMTLLSLQIFNRRRSGEVERLYLEDFKSYRGLDYAKDRGTYNGLSEEGKKLARKYVRFEIRGKLNRGVPVLLDSDMLDCLNLLIAHRKDARVPESNSYLFGLPSTDKDRHRHLQACDLMREYSVKCGAQMPETLRGTTLRKHIATRCINLNLTDGQVADLANFMGHAEKIHKDIYRQPVLETDIVKISKILNAAQGLDISDNESDDEVENEHSIPRRTYNRRSDHTEGDYADESNSFGGRTDGNSYEVNTRTSRAKHQWSSEEKNTVLSAFANQLEAGKVPSGKDMQQFIDSNICMRGRTVPQLRTWLHTQKKKISKT